MNTKDEKQDPVQSAAYNPFPEPQTVPSGWDTSGFFANAEPTSEGEAKDRAEDDSD